MKFLPVLLSTALLVFLGAEAVALHKRTVCRQEAWRESVRLHTRRLLVRSDRNEPGPIPRCRVLVTRADRSVSWRRIPERRRHDVPLTLRGRL